jgi:hypothetical protein
MVSIHQKVGTSPTAAALVFPAWLVAIDFLKSGCTNNSAFTYGFPVKVRAGSGAPETVDVTVVLVGVVVVMTFVVVVAAFVVVVVFEVLGMVLLFVVVVVVGILVVVVVWPVVVAPAGSGMH